MLFLGVMSGTSGDGVDVVLADFTDGVQVLEHGFIAYPAEIKTQIIHLIQDQQIGMPAYSQLDAALGHIYAASINTMLEQWNMTSAQVEAVGLHGQTVFHAPEGSHSNTLQLGSAAIVARQTCIKTVANFRQMDMAYGGQGAPLAPIFHQAVFAQPNQSMAVINLGGIANITLLKDGQVTGFDTGPASCLMDEWTMSHLGEPYDDQGQWARQGQIIQSSLMSMLEEPYFKQQPPKSTGRELFNPNWLQQHIHGVNKPEDVQRTLVQLTVDTLVESLTQVADAIDLIICCGGGVHNKFMMELLAEKMNQELKISTDLGLHADYVEATLMAWLAHQRVSEQWLDLSSITGTEKPLLYGVVYQP